MSIDDNPRWHFRFAERFNTTTFLAFLQQLVRYNRGHKLFVVLDNVGYHHAHPIKDWVAQNADKIELFFLPAYSPELNAVEFVWRSTRRLATHNLHFKTIQCLRSKLFRRFNRYQGNPSSLRAVVNQFREVSDRVTATAQGDSNHGDSC